MTHKLKERLKFLLSIWESRATDPAIRQVHSAAVAWVEQIRTGGRTLNVQETHASRCGDAGFYIH